MAVSFAGSDDMLRDEAKLGAAANAALPAANFKKLRRVMSIEKSLVEYLVQCEAKFKGIA
jgi:hypothetical protein